MNVNDKIYRETVYALVRQIPVGKVTTYGQIAAILGDGYTARTIGYVMHGADSESVPWQRVINSQGKCSTGRLTIPINLQQELLETEGVVFNANDKCDLGKFQWFPVGLEPERIQPSLLF
jgi:methylated-DNA-protein-cysteine methyltransferase-like protein